MKCFSQTNITKVSDFIIIAEFCDRNFNTTGFYLEEISKDLAEHSKITIVSAYINPDLRNKNNVQCYLLREQYKFSEKSVHGITWTVALEVGRKSVENCENLKEHPHQSRCHAKRKNHARIAKKTIL